MTPVERVCVVAAVASIGIAAQAAPVMAQSPEAEVLFREGRKLVKAGKIGPGCDKLEASERIETSVGTLLNLGDCREKLGQYATAWAAFRKAEALAKRSGGDAKRLSEAQRRATALEPRLSHLVINVSQRIDGLVVKRDGDVVDPAVWNTAVPVDPDTYEIVVEAPGYKTWRAQVPVDGNPKRRVVYVPVLERAPAPIAEPAPPAERATADAGAVRGNGTVDPYAPGSTGATAAPPSPDARRDARVATIGGGGYGSIEPATAVTVRREPSTWTGTRTFAAGVAIAGTAALGTGAYFGVRANDLEGQANARCPLASCSDPEGLRLNSEARTAAMRANVFLAAGGVAVGTALVLWFVGGPSETTVAPTVGGDGAGVAFGGTF